MATENPSIVWTRAAEDWAEDAELLAPVGNALVHLPCIATCSVEHEVPEGSYSVAVLTSRKAVAYAIRDADLAQLMGELSLVTFGAGTAADLRAHGLSVIHATHAKSAEELAQHLVNTISPGERVLVIGAKEPNYDIVGHLEHEGREATYLPIYRTDVRLEVTAAQSADLTARLSGVICFASPSAVRAFALALSPGTNRLATALVAVTIGRTTLKAAQAQFARCVNASRQDIGVLASAAIAEWRRLKGEGVS